MPPAVIIGLIVAGTALEVGGNIQKGKAAKAAGKAAQAREEFNASVADLQAQDAIVRGADDESTLRTLVRGTIGRQRVGFATQGVDVNSGSPLEVQADTAYLGELDSQRVRANAAREAWGHTVEAEDHRLGGQYARMTGNAAATNAYIGAGAAGLEGATSIALFKYGMKRAGGNV